AQDYLNIYNVQLTQFRKQKHDLSKPLNAWLTLLDTANQKHITVEEVVKMYPELGNTVKSDPGINQFVGKYNVVSKDALMRSEYDMYLSELFRIGGIKQYAYEEGKEEGILSTARNMLMDGLPIESIAKYTELPIETIKNLK
ncbi:MAG: hypothetical protein LBL87_04125, partial [Ruminococcus sp.]|nr:hypothetical protein [Ruminococcus sp.]